MIPLTHLTAHSPDLGHKVHSHTGAPPWGRHLRASSWLFLQISKVRAGKGGDFLWNPDLLVLDPYCLLVPQKGQSVRGCYQNRRKTLQGWSAQISSRTNLGALDKRHLERPFPPPPSAVLNLASFSAVGLGEGFIYCCSCPVARLLGA